MATYTDLLAPTKTHKHRAVKWTPACRGVGVLEVTDTKSHTRYAAAVQPYGGVRLTKPDGETYVVTVGTCECRGYVFSNGKPCKHIDAVACLLANRWLEHDGLETVGDKHERADELDAYYAGHDFDNSPDRMRDDEHADSLGRKLVCEMGGC